MTRYVLFFLSFFPFALSAQIVWDQSDLPSIGDEYKTCVNTSVADLDLGQPGGNQQWDFSDLVLTTTSVTAFVDPAVFFDNQGDFPGADIVETGTRIKFLNITDEGVYDMGRLSQFFGQPYFSSVPYEPPARERALPTSMDTLVLSDFSFDLVLVDTVLGVDSVRIKHEESRHSLIDAWGNITTPSGNFDALRERLVVNTIDSVWSYEGDMDTLTGVFVQESFTYNWLVKGLGIPLVSVKVQGDTLIQNARWWVADFVQPPVPIFSYTYESDEGLLQFTDLSAHEPESWLWEFGDGQSSTEQNPQHQYAAPGTYEICLTVENQFGSNTACQTVYIFFGPKADFSVETLGSGLYAFTDLSTDSILLWHWDFGDGTPFSIEQNPEHLYEQSGQYEVCLTASNPAGSDTFCDSVDVVAPPVADFAYENTGTGEVTFADSSANLPDNWLWDFGDGSTSTEQNPVHEYAEEGSYTVCLEVSNAAGTDEVCMEVEMLLAPIAAFTYENQGDALVAFTDASGNNPESWLWDFGDGQTSMEQNPVHQYNGGGNYTVCLTVNKSGFSDTYCDSSLHVIGTAVKDLTLQQFFRLYPNPVEDEAVFSLEGARVEGSLYLEICDAVGRTVYFSPFDTQTGKQVIPVHSWLQGSYFYKLSNARGQVLAAGLLLR